MSAHWGRVHDTLIREYCATCSECAWQGEGHFELDSDAVQFSAEDCARHNAAHHAPNQENGSSI